MSDHSHAVHGNVSGIVFQADHIYGDVTVHDEKRRLKANHLPLDIATFVNRHDERARFADCVLEHDDRTEPRIVLVCGSPGSGRTTLAVKAINEHLVHSGLSDQFDLLHVEVSGGGPGATTDPEAVVDRVLAGLNAHRGDQVEDLPAKQRRLRSITKGRRVVILLDDAVVAAQVHAILPGSPESLVVVTTTSSFPTLRRQQPGIIMVPAMSTAHTVAQLRAELRGDARPDTEPDALWELARQCHGMPILATVAAGQLCADPDLGIARLVERIRRQSSLQILGAGEDDNVSLTAILNTGYEGLDADAARAYRIAGLHPTPSFDVWAVAAAMGWTAAATREVLGRLCSAGLLARDTRARGHRYVVNPAVHQHAERVGRRDSTSAEEVSAMAGFAAYYVCAGLASDAMLTPRWQLDNDYPRPPVLDLPEFTVAPAGDSDEVDARQWIGANIQAIVALVRPGRDGEEPLIGTRGFAGAMALATDGYFRGTGMSPDRLLLLDTGRKDAKAHGRIRAQARIHNQWGFGCLEIEDWDQAHQHFSDAVALSESVDDGPGQGGALEALGILAGRRGRCAEALTAFDRALPFLRAMGRSRSIALVQMHRARALIGLDRSAEALELLELAETLLGEERKQYRPDPVNEGKVLLGTSEALLRSGSKTAAHDKAAQALEVFTGQNALFQCGQAFEALARSAPTDPARTGHLRSAIEVYEAIGNERAAQRLRTSQRGT